MKRDNKMKTVIISMENIEESFEYGYMNIECPYCNGSAHAEIDADITCCLDCDKHIILDNEYC